MATVVHLGVDADSTDGSSFTTGSFTPTLNDLLVVIVEVSGSTQAGGSVYALTDTNGVTYYLAGVSVGATSADSVCLFIAEQLSPAVAATWTFTCTGQTATGAAISIERVTGMTRTGAESIRQFAKTENIAAGGTPSATFPGVCLTGNPTIYALRNAANPPSVTAPVGWTALVNTGYTTPTKGMSTYFRNSGFTGTAITSGATSATPSNTIAVELDISAFRAPPEKVFYQQTVARTSFY